MVRVMFSSQVMNLKIASPDGDESLMFSNVFVIDEILVSSAKFEMQSFSHLADLPLTAYDRRTHILIGQGNLEAIIPLEVRNGNKGEPFTVKTLFG